MKYLEFTDIWRHQTILWFDVRNIETNESVDCEEVTECIEE